MENESLFAEKRKIVLILEYNGTNYFGFQWQQDKPTVQDEIEKALWRLTKEKLRVISASRTDTGVHAKGQVVSFRTTSELSPKTFVSGLNHYLPKDIAVKEAYQVAGSLNIRKEAISREYKYYILNRKTRSPLAEDFSHLVKEALDVDAMNSACLVLLGEHDFISFASALSASRLKNTVRRVYEARVQREGEIVVFTIVANSFLPHQVRNTVGSLIRVGLGRMSIAGFKKIVGAKKPALSGPAAPASGLHLIKVNYPFSFEEKAE